MAEDILAVIEEAIKHYRPEGEFAETRTEQLKEYKPRYTAEAQAQLTGRGLAGTTLGAAIPATFERTVAKPWRTETEMLRGQRLMDAIMAKAGIMERAIAREEQMGLSREEMELQKLLAGKQETLTREQMELQRELALKQMRSRERMTTGGGGAGGGSPWIEGGGVPRKYVPGLGTTTDWGRAGEEGDYYAQPGAGYGDAGGGGFGGIPEGVMIGGEMYGAGIPSAKAIPTRPAYEETQPGAYGTWLPYGGQGATRYIPFPKGYG